MTLPMVSAFGLQLRVWRVAADHSQRTLGVELGVSDSLILHWENGRRYPGDRHHAALERALGLDRGAVALAIDADDLVVPDGVAPTLTPRQGRALVARLRPFMEPR